MHAFQNASAEEASIVHVVLFNVFLDRENKMKNVQLLGKNLILLFQDTIDVMASIWVLTKETGQSNDNVICRFKGKLRTE